MKLSSPWVNFYREVEALFKQDDEVRVVFDDENYELRIYVDNSRKADALSQLLPTEKAFGNVVVKVTVVPSNANIASKVDALREAFCGNPALASVFEIETPMGRLNYAVFQNRVVQYFNDDLGDIDGKRSTLYQEIAKDVFGEDIGLFFCTESGEKSLSKPLGEWP